ncbi:MAG: glycosyltransferase [Candidatus Azobacteroides sp.]|nr:glycosyltransferase [Candidatus Azobacteroides sp.]
MKIAFALVAHYPTDDRVYFQLAETLKQAGHKVFIISTLTDNCDLPDIQCFDSKGWSKKLLIDKLQDCFSNCNPSIIICDNPIAILAAGKYKKLHKEIRIVYDVTEWYPSKKNLKELPFFKKIMKIILLSCLSVYAGCLTDAFVFGEHYKAKPFRFLFSWKKYIYLSYYASIDQINIYPQKNIHEKCNLFYSGPLTIEKGFDKVLDVSNHTAKNHPETKFILTIITGTNDYPISTDLPENLLIQRKGLLPFSDFCKEIGKYDLFFDLRTNDVENTRSLPIKLFYYMACGRPMIYANLKAIRQGVPEMEQMGYLVNPMDLNEICECISNYLSDDELYKSHCETARKSALEKYNWDIIKDGFIQLISEL